MVKRRKVELMDSSIFGDLLKMIGILFAIAVVFFLAWFVTRAVAMSGSFSGRGKYFTVLEKLPITRDSYIMLIKSFDKLLLVGATASGMTLLKEYDADSVNLEDFKLEKQNFSDIFKTAIESTIPNGKLKERINSFSLKKKDGSGNE